MISPTFSQTVKPFVVFLSVVCLCLPTIKTCSALGFVKSATRCFLWALGIGLMLRIFLSGLLFFLMSRLPSMNNLSSLLNHLILLFILLSAILVTYNVSRHFPRFMHHVDLYLLRHALRPRTIPLQVFQGVAWLVLALLALAAVINAILFSYIDPSCLHSALCTYHAVLLRLGYVCFTTHLLSPAILYIFVWLTLTLEATRFNIHLKNFIAETSSNPEEDLEGFRLRHMSLCRLVESGNDVLRLFLVLTYVGGILLMLVEMGAFLQIGGQERVVRNIPAMVVVGQMFLQVALVTLTAAVLNIQMHRPISSLYEVNLKSLDDTDRDSVMLFLNHLQFETIAFNLLGLVPLDASTIRLVIGNVTTYFVISLATYTVMNINSSMAMLQASVGWGQDVTINATATANTSQT